MNVTYRGTPRNDRIWLGKCNSCQSEAEAEEREMVNRQSSFRDDGEFCWMQCPVCGMGNEQLNWWGGMCFHPKKEQGK